MYIIYVYTIIGLRRAATVHGRSAMRYLHETNDNSTTRILTRVRDAPAKSEAKLYKNENKEFVERNT